MGSPATLLREMRLSAGLSQRALANRADTSQPAVARYERGSTIPSWETLQRLAAGCGRRINLTAEMVLDPHDVELVERQLALTPEERLRALRRYAHLHELAQDRHG
ncbi:MAG: helix-turn-helix transcriptional regulator [Solirubrobacterales bacterium]